MDASPRGIHRRTHVRVTDALRKRFIARVKKAKDAECWPWLGAMRNGYGAIKHDGKVLSAHVVAWVLHNKSQPRVGNVICHHCDNRVCCNPSHLYEGSFRDNASDMDKRRVIARPKGSELPQSVLTETDVRLVRAIRRVNGWGKRRISRALNKNESTIESVIRSESWNHVIWPTLEESQAIVQAWKKLK